MKAILIIITSYLLGLIVGLYYSNTSNDNTNTSPTNVPDNPPTSRTNWSDIVRSHSHNI